MRPPSTLLRILFAGLIATAFLVHLHASPIIAEFAAGGQGVLADDDDDHTDWIELHNPTESGYLLNDHFLTNDPTDLTKWTFPKGQSIPAKGYYLVHASRKDRFNIFRNAVHTNFALDDRSGFLALVAPDGETVLHQWEDYPKQPVGVTYGLDAQGTAGYFAELTPGAANGLSVPELVKDTAFSVDRGFHEDPFDLVITCATPDANIYYTLDGSEPDPSSGLLFEAPIAIGQTTIVRARAFKDGMIPSNIDTQSYLYLTSVINQGREPENFPNRWGSVSADYEFDTSVGTEEAFREALLGYPSVSLVMPQDSWFNPSAEAGTGGIYANSLRRGQSWEKVVSAEFINFADCPDYQLDCGIRIYGNASRQTSRPKHNMRLAFRARYGPSKLDFPVFGKDKATGINGLLFNGQNGDSWFHPNIGQREAASYLRDHFAHELLGDMGHLTPPQSRAHVYVNGLYWGFYQTVERVDHHFMARLLGGEPEEYDSMKASIQEGPTLVAGNQRAYDEMFELADEGLEDDDAYAATQEYLDLTSFIDYMIINFWTGNRDWDHNNWRSGRHRSEGSPWHYFMWDSENIFKEAGIDRTGLNTADNPSRLHQQLAKNPNYRLLFADRVQKHLFDEGVLTEEAVLKRWNRWAGYIRSGLLAESARWGDHHRAGNPHTVEEDFDTAYRNLITNMFPSRARNALRQFRSRELYPAQDRSIQFSQRGGPIEPPSALVLSVGNIFSPQPGDIVFTVDGSDPQDGGSVYDTPLSLTESTTVSARHRDLDGLWGPLTRLGFTVGATPEPGDLLISEIHYHPADPTETESADGLWSARNLEFVEIWNASPQSLQLDGVAFTTGIRFAFPPYTLAPNQRLVVVENAEAFQMRYQDTSKDSVIGAYQGQLSNGGEQLTLSGMEGQILHAVFYDDEPDWPEKADGQGPSLILSDPNQSEDASGWSLSSAAGGTPGRVEGGGPPPSDALPAALAEWLAARGLASPLDTDPKRGTPYLITFAFRLDAPNSGWARLNRDADGALSLVANLRPEALEWPLELQESTDLQSWSAAQSATAHPNEPGHWTIDARDEVPFYRIRISLPPSDG